jgi:hypothetical protein
LEEQLMSALTPSDTASAAPPAAGTDSLAAAAAPCGRASWSGLLQLSLVTVPVNAYPATVSSHAVHFNQLHADCGQRIRHEKHCPVQGKVEAGAIASGYPYAPDRYVVVDEAELEKLRLAQDRALSLERFLDPDQLDPALFAGRSLYLLPDGLAPVPGPRLRLRVAAPCGFLGRKTAPALVSGALSLEDPVAHAAPLARDRWGGRAQRAATASHVGGASRTDAPTSANQLLQAPAARHPGQARGRGSAPRLRSIWRSALMLPPSLQRR